MPPVAIPTAHDPSKPLTAMHGFSNPLPGTPPPNSAASPPAAPAVVEDPSSAAVNVETEPCVGEATNSELPSALATTESEPKYTLACGQGEPSGGLNW